MNATIPIIAEAKSLGYLWNKSFSARLAVEQNVAKVHRQFFAPGSTCRPPSHNPFCEAPPFVFALGPPNLRGGPACKYQRHTVLVDTRAWPRNFEDIRCYWEIKGGAVSWSKVLSVVWTPDMCIRHTLSVDISIMWFRQLSQTYIPA